MSEDLQHSLWFESSPSGIRAFTCRDETNQLNGVPKVSQGTGYVAKPGIGANQKDPEMHTVR